MHRTSTFALAAALFLSIASSVALASPRTNAVGVSGYDLVSFHVNKRPVRGSGHFVSTHDGVSYLFANAENKKKFDRNPAKYLPAYGGYCAFGVSVGKKFNGDPEVWRIVNDRLYLNLDANIQDNWLKDVPGNIKKANKNWKRIKNVEASKL